MVARSTWGYGSDSLAIAVAAERADGSSKGSAVLNVRSPVAENLPNPVPRMVSEECESRRGAERARHWGGKCARRP